MSAENESSASHAPTSADPTAESSAAKKPQETDGGGPLNLAKIRQMRQQLQTGAKKSNTASVNAYQSKKPSGRPAAPAAEAVQDPGIKPPREPLPSTELDATAPAGDPLPGESAQPANADTPAGDGQRKGGRHDRQDRRRDKRRDDDSYTAQESTPTPRVAVPSTRTPLSDDQLQQLEAALGDADLDALMIGSPDLAVGRSLDIGDRRDGRVLKIHNEQVFISLGGPDEGVVPLLQFNDTPQPGQTVHVLIRGYNEDEGSYELSLPGEAVTVEDWSDLQSGTVVEARIEGANTGGLEAKVGSIRGFIPMSQIAEYRVEDASGFVGQTLPCVITEANQRRGNLVLSHRAVLEREKAEKRAERLAAIEVGDVTEGVVRKIMDFGAFVDIGGLDGLIHISQLSWERVKHPSEVLEEGQKVQVRIEKIDPDSGKIGLSYRALQSHPWDDAEADFPVGSIVSGTVSRIADFGVFIKLAPAIEGLVHISELSHRRVASASSVVGEGDSVQVKVLSIDKESQRMALSIKQATAAPADAPESEQADEPVRKPAVPKRHEPLKGGIGGGSGGQQFGLKW